MDYAVHMRKHQLWLTRMRSDPQFCFGWLSDAIRRASQEAEIDSYLEMWTEYRKIHK